MLYSRTLYPSLILVLSVSPIYASGVGSIPSLPQALLFISIIISIPAIVFYYSTKFIIKKKPKLKFWPTFAIHWLIFPIIFTINALINGI
jgi:hypothetical protein